MERYSTTIIAKKLNLDRDELFKRLEVSGFITRDQAKKPKLTEKGIDVGGELRNGVNAETGEFYEYIVWSDKQLIDSGVFTSNEVEKFDANTEDESEGENYIAEYFDKIGIKYRQWEFVNNKTKLNGDYLSYRESDFYLPDYNIYVEFAGLWNRSDNDREQYRFKRKIYEENKVPCIWIYPDNLGVLHYFFHKRLEAVLGNYQMEKQLLKYRLKIFWRKDDSNFGGVALGLILMFLLSDSLTLNDNLFLIGGIIIAYNVYHIAKDLINISKGKSLEVSRLNSWEEDY